MFTQPLICNTSPRSTGTEGEVIHTGASRNEGIVGFDEIPLVSSVPLVQACKRRLLEPSRGKWGVNSTSD